MPIRRRIMPALWVLLLLLISGLAATLTNILLFSLWWDRVFDPVVQRIFKSGASVLLRSSVLHIGFNLPNCFVAAALGLGIGLAEGPRWLRAAAVASAGFFFVPEIVTILSLGVDGVTAFRQFGAAVLAATTLWQLLPVLFLLGGAWAGQRLLRNRRRRNAGLCLCCAYDLRASKDCCPECGWMIPTDFPRPNSGAVE